MWTWLAPVVAGLVVFVGVLLVTPPGFASIVEVVLGTTRGGRAEAGAYALGAAASLALLALAAVWAACALIDAFVRRRRR